MPGNVLFTRKLLPGGLQPYWFFNEKGKEIIRSEAFFKVFHTQGIFDYVLSGSYKKQPSFQRYLTERADHIMEQGKNVDIW